MPVLPAASSSTPKGHLRKGVPLLGCFGSLQIRVKPEASMTINTESQTRFESQVEFWVLVLANAGLIAVSMLGLILYYNIVRLFN
jgi:hypothetical protein